MTYNVFGGTSVSQSTANTVHTVPSAHQVILRVSKLRLLLRIMRPFVMDEQRYNFYGFAH